MKKLHAGKLYWPDTMGEPERYPALDRREQAQVVIVGGGMSGITCGYWFVKNGYDTVLVERNEVAGGSTSANTGLLQFCNDIMMTELGGKIGARNAETFYKACLEAVNNLAAIAAELPDDVSFISRSSLYYASTEQDLPKLRAEYEALNNAGFPVEFWTPEMIETSFGFSKPGAMVTHGDAEVNPYRFVHAMAKAAAVDGLRIYEHTDIISSGKTGAGKHVLEDAAGHIIEADYIVYSVGYEPEELRPRLSKADLNRSYVIVTPVQEPVKAWHGSWLLWESARPYLYLRTTADGRIIVGGLDEEKEQPVTNANRLNRKSQQLSSLLRSLFPEADNTVEYEWNGTFGESLDDLPFIGEDPERTNVFYCLGYGGNGTVYSMLGAKLLLDLIQSGTQRQHPFPYLGIR
ncbi:NAD(P)/FAD-dependent oxidoreductase [Paenibacillus sp. CAU 1782]